MRIQNAEFATLTREQIDEIEKFVADYNAIDLHLRSELRVDKPESFTYLVNHYSRKHPNWRDANLLRTVAELRNSIVHGKTEPYEYVAIPAPAIVRSLNQCRIRLLDPPRVIPKFQRRVETVSTMESLDHVFRLIAERDYSQFPAYDDGHFAGLLTENGITRWISANVEQEVFGLRDILISEVLNREEERQNCTFQRKPCVRRAISAPF